jgi:hypothetical protein
MVESSLVSYQQKIVDYQIGASGSVAFDFGKIWNLYKRYKKCFCFGSLNFFHVHPENMLKESEIDINCIKGFFQAFNKNIYFHIICFKDDSIYNLNCDVLTLVYRGYGIEIEKMYSYNFKYQDDRFLVLKLLSYGRFNDNDKGE